MSAKTNPIFLVRIRGHKLSLDLSGGSGVALKGLCEAKFLVNKERGMVVAGHSWKMP